MRKYKMTKFESYRLCRALENNEQMPALWAAWKIVNRVSFGGDVTWTIQHLGSGAQFVGVDRGFRLRGWSGPRLSGWTQVG